jgi:hypothetical protein
VYAQPWQEVELPDWAYQQIEEDLAPFRDTGITKEFLDSIVHVHDGQVVAPMFRGGEHSIMRVQIINNQVHQLNELTGEPARFWGAPLITALQTLAKEAGLPDLDAIFWCWDALYCNTQGPIFCWAKMQGCAGICCPDGEMLAGHPIDSWRGCQWHLKKPMVVWRGTTNGGGYFLDCWRERPRSRMVLYSLANPSYADARFVHAHDLGPGVREEMIQCGAFGEAMTIQDQLAYKYQIDIDGYTATFSHQVWNLCSGCVPLKVASLMGSVQWYYKGLVPWENYVPIAADLSDLTQTIDYLRNNDREARQIAKQSVLFGRTYLTREAAYQYLYQLLLHYAELQR